jgi:hypothetical protein
VLALPFALGGRSQPRPLGQRFGLGRCRHRSTPRFLLFGTLALRLFQAAPLLLGLPLPLRLGFSVALALKVRLPLSLQFRFAPSLRLGLGGSGSGRPGRLLLTRAL